MFTYFLLISVGGRGANVHTFSPLEGRKFQRWQSCSTLRWTNEYLKVPKFSDARKLCCNLSKIETKRPNLRVFCQNEANGIANSEDPDQTAPLGAV